MADPNGTEVMVLLYFDTGTWVPTEEEIGTLLGGSVLMHEIIDTTEEFAENPFEEE